MAFDLAIRPFDDFWLRPWDPWDDWFERRRINRRLPTTLELCKRMFDSMDHETREEMRKFWNTGEVQLNDKSFDVALDVAGYDPKELNVKVDNGFLSVEANHEEKSDDGRHYAKRQFMRRYKLPDNVNVDDIKSSLANQGRTLRINAPLTAVEPPKEVPIPIEVVKNTAIKQG